MAHGLDTLGRSPTPSPEYRGGESNLSQILEGFHELEGDSRLAAQQAFIDGVAQDPGLHQAILADLRAWLLMRVDAGDTPDTRNVVRLYERLCAAESLEG